MKQIAFIFLVALFITSCGNTENNRKIIGKWSGSEWLVNGSASGHNTAETHFSFDDKGNYIFTYAGTEEKGTYKVENDMLFTKPGNEEEIMVKITKLTADSMIFDMNRSGTTEVLTLLRDK